MALLRSTDLPFSLDNLLDSEDAFQLTNRFAKLRLPSIAFYASMLHFDQHHQTIEAFLYLLIRKQFVASLMDCNTEKSIDNDYFSNNHTETLLHMSVSILLPESLNHFHNVQGSSQSSEGPNFLGSQLFR